MYFKIVLRLGQFNIYQVSAAFISSRNVIRSVLLGEISDLQFIIWSEHQLVKFYYTDDSGKPEMSIVVYKVGECMQELIKLWKEYEASQTDKSGDFASNGPTLEVRIPAEHVTATNRQVR